MVRIGLYATEYLEQHTDTETRTAVEKILVNTRILRRGINIAVEDKFNTDATTNPYYDDSGSLHSHTSLRLSACRFP